MEHPGHRPATAGAHSARNHHYDSYNDLDGGDDYRPPARPSTQRGGRNSPRTEHVVSRVGLSVRRGSGSVMKGADPAESGGIEIASLRKKLDENELSKAQSQVQLKRQEAEMAKLERYITQLVDERGGLDAGVMEVIVKDMEKSSLMKRTQKQVADLKSDLRRKQQEVATLKGLHNSEDVVKLAEEKDALARRVEQLLVEKNEAIASLHMPENSKEHPNARMTAELDRLRRQNSSIRDEAARLRAKLELAQLHPGGNTSNIAHRGDRNSRRNDENNANGGPLFYEGQAVECREPGTESWSLGTVDGVSSRVETLSGGNTNYKTYVYSIRYDGGGHEQNIPEGRIRIAEGDRSDGSTMKSSARMIRRGDGEPVIRQRVFRPGDEVLARDTDSGSRSDEKWSSAEVVRRNSNGTYIVVIDGSTDEIDLHPAMLRLPADQRQKYNGTEYNKSGTDPSRSLKTDETQRAAPTPAEEAELRYDEQREALLAKARAALPGPILPRQYVLAKYPKSHSRNAWGAGVVEEVDGKGLHYDVSFECGRFDANIPCIFVRPKDREGGLLSRAREQLRPGAAVLAQKEAAGARDDYYPARVKEVFSGRDRKCSVIFIDQDEEEATVRLARVYPLDNSLPREDRDHHGGSDIPGNPPPPTKPVRAKKHHEGDIVLACVPTLKAWTPAVITGAKGRGRYSVVWADGLKVESLLFMYIAALSAPCSQNDGLEPRTLEADSADEQGQRHTRSVALADGGSSADRKGVGQERSHEGDCLPSSHSKSGGPQGRLRQRQLPVGEPVLAKVLDQDVWAPGSIKRVCGGGKYDVAFTDGTHEEELSFLFIRALVAHEVGTQEGEHQRDSDTSDEIASQHPNTESTVGDSVYCLRRGHAVDHASYDLHDRSMWRVGTVIAKSNGRFTLRYDHEEGKPQEARIVAERVRPRQLIRQKAAEKGDVVLALSKTPGRGWQMGAVTARHEGRYTIVFADGSEEKGIRFVNLRRVVDRDNEEGRYRKSEKPAARPIRQRRFRAEEVALAKHPDTRKWGVVKVLEAHPSGRYDLKFLGSEETIIMGAAFTSMRHLDVAGVASDSPVVHAGDQIDGAHTAHDNEKHRTLSDESWDDHSPANVGTQDRQELIADGAGDAMLDSRADEQFGVSTEVYVLRRGKKDTADLQDCSSWRPGRIIAVRSTGSFAVQYDEEGSPKEDRVLENRLRARRVHGDSSSHGASHSGGETFAEGDVVLAREDGTQAGRQPTMATVVEILGDGVYRVEYLDGSGTFEMESDQLSHLKEASDGGRNATLSGRGLAMPKKAVKMRKLQIGELVVAKRPDGKSGEGGEWFAGKITAAGGDGKYSVLFAGESKNVRIHFTRIRPLKIGTGDADTRQEEKVEQNLKSGSPLGSRNADKNSKQPGGRDVISTGVLRVADVSFNLSMAASSVRRASPRLVLATSERGQPGIDGADDDGVRFIARGPARAGTRNPSWRGNGNGVFWLALAGLTEPELYIGVEDGRNTQAGDVDVGGNVFDGAMMGEAYIPVPKGGVRPGTMLEVELNDGAGSAKLEWGTHDRVG